MARHEILIGTTKNGEIIFTEFEIKNRNVKNEFTASFSTSYPQEITEDLVIERIESLIDCMDKEWVLDKLESYDCKPSELAQELYADCYDVVDEFFDDSLYTERFNIEGVDDEIVFLASRCGQHDTRNEINKLFVDKEFYDYLHELWDNYHLKGLPQAEIDKLMKWVEKYENRDNEVIIQEWLETDVYNEK